MRDLAVAVDAQLHSIAGGAAGYGAIIAALGGRMTAAEQKLSTLSTPSTASLPSWISEQSYKSAQLDIKNLLAAVVRLDEADYSVIRGSVVVEKNLKKDEAATWLIRSKLFDGSGNASPYLPNKTQVGLISMNPKSGNYDSYRKLTVYWVSDEGKGTSGFRTHKLCVVAREDVTAKHVLYFNALFGPAHSWANAQSGSVKSTAPLAANPIDYSNIAGRADSADVYNLLTSTATPVQSPNVFTVPDANVYESNTLTQLTVAHLTP
jgi:hypothetical protein